MPYRLTPFLNHNFYHVFNRGVERRDIFSSDKDYRRFLETIYYYQFDGPKPKYSTYKRFKNQDFSKNPKIAEIVCFCLMPNHFHFLIRQLIDNGVTEFTSKVTNSYTKYFNTKYSRQGPLFQGEFKAVYVESDEQLIHLSRYIHLNPYVSDLIDNLENYEYSSYMDFVGMRNSEICNKELILNLFSSTENYKAFVADHSGYAKELEIIKHLLLDT